MIGIFPPTLLVGFPTTYYETNLLQFLPTIKLQESSIILCQYIILIERTVSENECAASESALQLVKDEITGEYTVFVLTAITLSFSVLCLVTAITLITGNKIISNEVSSIDILLYFTSFKICAMAI